MKRNQFWKLVFSVAVSLLVIATSTLVGATGSPYTFDYQDYWKEFRGDGGGAYRSGSRLPCNGGGSEANCTWAWKPWYLAGTGLPRYYSEQYTPRTVNGYAMMMYWYGTDKNIHGGIYRQESTQPCQTYRFTMWSRVGLEAGHPAPVNARVQLGISPNGVAPGQIVLTTDQLNQMVWSPVEKTQFTYKNLSVEAQAQGYTMTVYARGEIGDVGETPSNEPYFFWDEGSFSQVARTSPLLDLTQPLPAPTGGLFNITVSTDSSHNALFSWTTGNTTLGQVFYREVVTSTMPAFTATHQVYLPLVSKGTSSWSYSAIHDWNNAHYIQIGPLNSGATYEYIIVSYGLDGTCKTFVSETNPPRRIVIP